VEVRKRSRLTRTPDTLSRIFVHLRAELVAEREEPHAAQGDRCGVSTPSPALPPFDFRIGSEQMKGLTLDYALGCTFRIGVPAMQIGTVAKKVGVSVDAIRFYERNSLLPRAARSEGGFRQYGERDIETLAFIRRVQGLGFKLSEIRSLVGLRGSRMQPCALVRRRLQAKLADVREKLANLKKLEHELRLALRGCDKELRKQDAHCPILTEKNSHESKGRK
jgi:DNA-binding transcriptional MerR regulator